MCPDSNQDLGEKVVSKIVEIGLDQQLEAINDVKIELDSEIFDLLQGKVNAIKLEANQVVTPNDLSLETVEFSSDRISVDLIRSILAGETQLTESIDANLVVSLTAQDLNKSINSPTVKQWLKHIEFSTAKASFYLQLQQAETLFLDSNQIKLFLELTLYDNNQPLAVAIDVVLKVVPEKNIIFKQGTFVENKELPLIYIATILNKLKAVLETDWLKIANTSIKIKTIEVVSGRLKLGLQVKIAAT